MWADVVVWTKTNIQELLGSHDHFVTIYLKTSNHMIQQIAIVT